MSYLPRAAGRLAVPRGQAPRSAIPSRSPLAAADQRLNLPGFADRAASPVRRHDSSDGPAPDEPLMPGVSGDKHKPGLPQARLDKLERPRSTGKIPTPPVSPLPSGPVSSTPRSGITSDTTAIIARGRISPQSPGTAATSGTPKPTGDPRPAPTTDSSLVRPTAERARRSDTLGRSVPREIAPDSSGGSKAGHTTATVDDVAPLNAQRSGGGSEGIAEALGRAVAWVERRPSVAGRDARGSASGTRERSEPRARPLAVGTGAALVPFAARDQRTAAPVARLEIGRIEVEVVAAPQPAARAAPQRLARPAARPLASPARTFGWRQR
jgi:hypothetical protein